MTKDTGGLAFPVHPDISLEKNHEWAGMNLRDWFAAKAMAGWMASYGEEATHPSAVDGEARVAELSYKMADAMILQRSKR